MNNNNSKELDLSILAESLKEIPGAFDNQQPNYPQVVPRAASVVDVEFDDSEVHELERFQTRDDFSGPIRTVHEKTLDEVEIGEIPNSIPPEYSMVPVAVVQHFMGNYSIAKSIEGRGVSPGSLLADQNRNPITRVIELFGPVNNPQIILRGQIPIGTELYAVIPESDFPDPDQIAKQFRGCDASNRFDEEDPYQDFSDDEEEREYKKRMKAMKKTAKPRQDDQEDQKVTYGYPRNYFS